MRGRARIEPHDPALHPIVYHQCAFALLGLGKKRCLVETGRDFTLITADGLRVRVDVLGARLLCEPPRQIEIDDAVEHRLGALIAQMRFGQAVPLSVGETVVREGDPLEVIGVLARAPRPDAEPPIDRLSSDDTRPLLIVPLRD